MKREETMKRDMGLLEIQKVLEEGVFLYAFARRILLSQQIVIDMHSPGLSP